MLRLERAVANKTKTLGFGKSMDPTYSVEVLRYLEKQNELLMEAKQSMTHQLHQLLVEEDMLMRKFYDIMCAQGLTDKKTDNRNVSDDNEAGHSIGVVGVDDNRKH